MIVDVTGPGRRAALARAASRFDTLLDELAAELPRLRRADGVAPTGNTAKRMVTAISPFKPRFITPMAAVAGAGADTILDAICAGCGIEKAYVNNGGDVAFHLGPGEQMTAAVAGTTPGRITIRSHDPLRGIASSGWRGRSHSRGIADTVTVLAGTAAEADAAATMIANAVDLPDHPNIARAPACKIAPESDLGSRPVTTDVGALSDAEMLQALESGTRFAAACHAKGLIHTAILMLGTHVRTVGATLPIEMKDRAYA